ncbi:MAG: hypothetical protein DWQ19_08925 [Crenarchaeota archaeon]|nr:MAG: hypothetical protein DWQ19_08925 [Thermoproteota archaeon]
MNTPTDHPKFLFDRRYADEMALEAERVTEKYDFDDEQVDDYFDYLQSALRDRWDRIKKRRAKNATKGDNFP